MQKIPINNKAKNQSFKVVLDDEEFVFTLRLNTRANRWSFGIIDANSSVIYQGLFLVQGVDYLDVIKDSRFPDGALYVVNNKGDLTVEPGSETLGESFTMYYLSDAEKAEIFNGWKVI